MEKAKKHKLIIISIAVILLVVILVITSIFVFKDNDTSTEVIQKVVNVDSENRSNISTWQQIPIVSQELKNKGISGGEGGQWPLCISGDNTNGSLMFYGTDVGGVYKSENGGKSWNKTLKGLYAQGACDIEIDPNNNDRVILFGVNGNTIQCTNGIYLSNDRGKSWNFIQHFPVSGHRNVTESIAFDPSSWNQDFNGSKIIYLSLIEKFDYVPSQLNKENRGLYRSNDGGFTWTRINENLGDAIVKVDNFGNVYVANYNGLFISRDEGNNFSLIKEGNITGLDIVNNQIYFLQCQTGENNYSAVYNIVNDEIRLISELKNGDVDQGGNDFGNVNMKYLPWHESYVKEGKDTNYLFHYSNKVHQVSTIKVSPVNQDNMLMVIFNDGYYDQYNSLYSNDGGNTWTISSPNEMKNKKHSHEQWYIEDYNILPHNYRKMDFYWSPINENLVFDIENDWISSSCNAGKTFLWNSNGVNGILCGGKFNFNVNNPDLMYFGSQDYNGALTTDGGKTWKYIDLYNASWGGFIYGGYAASENVIFGAYTTGWFNDRYLAISYDGGKTVKNYNGNPNYKISGGRKKSNGQYRLNGQANFVSYQSKINENILFCGDLISKDFGLTWNRMSNVTGVFAQDERGVLFGINDNLGQVVYSTDFGQTWIVIAESADLNKYWVDNSCYISDLAYDDVNKIIYITVNWSQLFALHLENDYSLKQVVNLSDNIPEAIENQEDIVQNLGSNYFPRRLTTVAVDPNLPEIIYVGGSSYTYRSNATTFRSCDGGKTFYILNAESERGITQGVQGGSEPVCIRVNPKTGYLWSAGNCLGFSKINPPYETDESLNKSLYTVYLELNGGKFFANKIKIFENRKLILNEYPSKKGFKFVGWYIDKSFEKKYTFDLINENIVLYAKWQKK